MMIDSVFPILEVPDLDAALAFYGEGLGGVVRYRFPAEGDPVYVSLETGSTTMGIGVTESPLPPGNMLLWFYVDDVDRVAAKLEAGGAPVLEPPVDQPWGERTALVEDPFGTRVRLGARTGVAGG
jgi:uncharacterized glyoxalase superfamily protein PhnB